MNRSYPSPITTPISEAMASMLHEVDGPWLEHRVDVPALEGLPRRDGKATVLQVIAWSLAVAGHRPVVRHNGGLRVADAYSFASVSVAAITSSGHLVLAAEEAVQ